jgi:RNA polymerase sigma-70 factor (ECF subfamily)
LSVRPSSARAAVAAALSAHRRALFAAAYAVLGRAQEAEDAVQDACVKALGGAADLRDPERPLPWLFRIVRNAALDRLRARRDAGVGGVELRPADAAARPEPRGAHEDVDRAVRSLPDALRLVITLKYVGGMTYAEIARLLDVPESTVLGRLQRARESLRSILGGR